MSDVYAFTLETSKGRLPLKDFQDRPLVVVNVASRCGLTPQYKDLQALHEKYGDKIGIFKAQEPGNDDEILQFCQANYGVTFPIAKKADVNGDGASELYKYLKSHAEPPVQDIDWNFSKFLVHPGGKVQWFPARTSKVADVEAALGLNSRL